MIGFDPLYLVFVAPAMLLAFFAQMKVKSAYAKASTIQASTGYSGAEVADLIMRTNGVSGVSIEQTDRELGDHYDPKGKVLRLSPGVFAGRSLASLGIAAHEVGHALQDAQHYGPLKLRNGIVPLASMGGNISMGVMMLGVMLNSLGMVTLGIALFSLVVIFQLVNLPVEFDASHRARKILLAQGIVTPAEDETVRSVLSAAALTYVAATVTAIATLLYYLVRSGLLGSRKSNR